MINEILERKNEIETNKMLEAIHNQAKENYYLEKGKAYLKNSKKYKKEQQKKEIKERLINDTLNFVLFVIAVVPPMLLLIVLHK